VQPKKVLISMDVTCERSQSTVVMPVQLRRQYAGITVMEAGHPFIDCSKVQKEKQLRPISSQPKPSMVRRSTQLAKVPMPISP
jgi:hypothetical protein